MDSWFLLTLLGSGLIQVGASNTTTGKLPFVKIGTWNRILFIFMFSDPSLKTLVVLKKEKINIKFYLKVMAK